MTKSRISIAFISLFLIYNVSKIDCLYYDGLTSYSIYPRLDLQLCINSTLSFDFTVSTLSNSLGFYNNHSNINYYNNLNSAQGSAPYGRLLLYAEQQIYIHQTNTNSFNLNVNSNSNSNKKLINSYFLVKLVNSNRLVVNDYWNSNDITFQLPSDYTTSWYRFVYSRRMNMVDISLFKFETPPANGRLEQSVPLVKLTPVLSKQILHPAFVMDDLSETDLKNDYSDDVTQVSYSSLVVGGIGENLNNNEKNYSYPLLKQLAKFNGFLMNLQYTSLASQCSFEMCSRTSISQRQYAIFSSSSSKQYKLQQFVDRDSLMIDDICESDTLTHDICPKDCSCLSNNFVAPYFNCDCGDGTMGSVGGSASSSSSSNSKQQLPKCSSMFKSFAINLDDTNYFGTNKDKFDYPILPSFTKINIQNVATSFDKVKGIQFRNTASRMYLMPSSDVHEADACFWNIDDCSNGFVQHMIMSIDRLDEKKYNNKAVLFINGQNEIASKFVCYLHKNRLYFSIYEYTDNVEWLVSSFPLEQNRHLNRQFKITISWLRDKFLSLHFDGFLIDMVTKPLSPPANQDIYMVANNLNRFYYEYGVKIIQSNDVVGSKIGLSGSHLDKVVASSIINHQFTLKYIRRDYFNNLDVQDSKIIVSSPLPSEIIRIDNTQRVMYKIDSPLTGVTTETIELSFRTTQLEGVIFYIKNKPINTYFELVGGQPVVVIDIVVKNVYLRPQTPPLNDNQWHEVKLHRDNDKISISIDSQYYDATELSQSHVNQILTGGYVYLGLADPNNVNLSNKKTFIGEMVRGKVTINNIQQKVVQQPYYWPSMPAITTNQTVNIDTSQLAHDGKMINIIINVYGPPGFSVNGQQAQNPNAPDTHLIYLDDLQDSRYISVVPDDGEIDFGVISSELRAFYIKFQTRIQCGQLVTLINDKKNYIGLEIFDGYLYSTTSISGNQQRYQISKVRVDDGRIYQVNLKQEQQKLLCWLDKDESYKQSINLVPIYVNTVRVAGVDGYRYGYSSRTGFVGCIGAIILNDRDVIDYKFVSEERRQSCQGVIHQPVTTPATTTPIPPPTTPAPVSLGYISFTRTADILIYNYFYDHEKPEFEDISFIFRTVVSNGILFSAHNNDENHNPHLVGAYIRDGLVHVIYLNSSSVAQDLYFNSTIVDDGSLYRLNIRRNINGHGFIQLQSYVGVTALDFYTQPGPIKFSKIIVGGADEWSRIRFFGTKSDFVGCIIDLFQVNGISVIKPADIPKERYNCNVERPRPMTTTTTARPTTPRSACLPEGYPLSFSSIDDALTFTHETRICDHIHIPFRTRDPRGIIYSHSSDDGSNYIIVFLRKGLINIIVRDSHGEKELELDSVRVDDGELHKLDIHCESVGYLIAYIDQNRQVNSNRVELYSPIFLNTYTLGYFNAEKLSSRYSTLDHFRGCLDQVLLNKDCLIFQTSADRNRLTCSVQPLPPAPVTTTTTTRRPACINTCYYSDNECVVEMDSRGYIVYHASEAGAQSSASVGVGRDSIRFTFRVTDLQDQDQDLFTIYHPDKNLRFFLSAGQPVLDIRGQRTVNIGRVSSYNDGKWHRVIIEQNNQDLIIRIDETSSSEYIPFDFDLFGNGRLYFGSSPSRDANNFHGFLKDIYVKYSNVEYDIIASAKDTRIPGVTCEGHVVLKSYVEQPPPKLRCVSEPVADGENECSTDGVCYASLWRNSSGVVERYMRCFNREQLQPPENPVLCRSQDLTRYVIQCCDTDYCNRDLQLKLKDLDEKDERSVWRFRGLNSGKIEFKPILANTNQPKQAELMFQFNSTKPDGNLMCSYDKTYLFKAEIRNQNILFSISDVKSRRVLKTASCQAPNKYNDNKWHKVHLSKRGRQVTIVCDDSSPIGLQYDIDIPFVNTHGVLFGTDCIDDRVNKFNGDISQIVYVYDGVSHTFDDLQYSEDPRFTYEHYVEFRPKFIAEVYSDPKPIFFRSSSSSARIDKWDYSKVGRISFEFKVEIADEDGLLFSTESGGTYFAISINDGYLETILSPHRVPYADSLPATSNYYDRYQRLFPHPKTRINDNQWHKLEFMMLGDSVGSFVLDDDFSSKLRFPTSYWNEESSIVFGSNPSIKREQLGSFRGCIRNIVINNGLIDWLKKGYLFNVEAGCYNFRYAPNQLLLLQGQQASVGLQNGIESASFVQFNGDGCLRYNPNGKQSAEKETLEFLFKTSGDHLVLVDSVNSDFIIHTQGPSLVVRNRDVNNPNSITKTVMERGIVFNDGNWHKLKLEKSDLKLDIEMDSKYKKEFPLSKRNRLPSFYLGCKKANGKNSKVNLRNFVGSMQNIIYSVNGNGKVDLLDKLHAGDPSLLVDGSVLWSLSPNGASNNRLGIVSHNKQPSSDDSAVTFKETSYLKLDKIDFDTNSNLSFSFRTNENDGLLAILAPSISSTQSQQSLSLVSSNYLAVELVNGSVSLVVYLDKQLKRVSCSPTSPPGSLRLNDNKWHQVQIRRDRFGNDESSGQPGSSITFSCDNNHVRVKVTEPRFSPIQFNSGNLSTNGQQDVLPSELWLARNNPRYLGCIRDLKINQKQIDIYAAATPESRQTLQKGCNENSSGQCGRSSKCLNQGECVEGFGRSYCNCDSISYTGAKCDLPASTLSFNGSHGLEISLDELTSSSAEDIVLRFRTRLRSGLLFALKKSADQPSMVVSLEDGRIKCVYDRNKNDKVIYVGDHNLFNNNKWHTVHIKRNGPTVLVEVIDVEKNKYYVIDDLENDFLNVLYKYIEIGSIKSSSLEQEHPNFIGWIQNVNFNGEDLFGYYMNDRLPTWASNITSNADYGENSLLLHHQITFTSECPIILPRVYSSERFNIHLLFKTSKENGVIFFRRGKEYRFMALELRDGHLRFVFDLGGGIKEFTSDQNVFFNDKNWHEITIKRFDRQKFSLKIDDFREFYIDIGTNNPPLSELESFIIGGVIPDYQKFDKENLGTQGFIGCLASLEINNDATDLYSNMLNLCPSVQYGCVDTACNADSCSNNGVCSISSNQVSCNCEMTSYTGPVCRDNSNFYFFGKQKSQCGLIKYAFIPPKQNQEQDRLAFGFTTTDSDALLVRIEGDNSQFIEIDLRDGLLQLIINLNNFEESKTYIPFGSDKKFNDNTYHVVQFIRDGANIQFRVDNFEKLNFVLKNSPASVVFKNQRYVYVGSFADSSNDLNNCYYGIVSGMFLNGHYVLDDGEMIGDVGIVDYKYISIDIEINRNRTKPLIGGQGCPLGYSVGGSVCIFVICPLNSDQIADSCSCYQGFYEVENACIPRNDTKIAPIIAQSSAKLIPATTRMINEIPIGLILGIISGIALAILAAAIGARKCSDGGCIPLKTVKQETSIATKVHDTIASTTKTTNDTYEMNTFRREEVPLIPASEGKYTRRDEYYKDTLDFGYNAYPVVQPPAPIYNQTVNETMEMYEQTVGGAATVANATVFNTGSMSHSAHHASHRDIAMSSLLYSQNNAADYELSNVTCLTMTPNGKYAIIGQSAGTPQIWDSISGLLVRQMNGNFANSSNLALTCNGKLLAGLAHDGVDNHALSLQVWEVQSGQPVQMSHQIKCCVFVTSGDSNAIYMAGNQRFGRGISVGVLDLVTNELIKEVKSDPNISFGESPESISITPDERHAIVGCRFPSGTNFVVFDMTKPNTEIALTKSIAFDADPKCIQVLNNNEVLTGTRGGHLLQWNLHTCQITVPYVDPIDSQAHQGSINQISLSDDKEFLVSASSDGTAKIWSTSQKSLLNVLTGHRGEVICASISNSDLVVTGSTDQTVGLWRLYGGSQISSMSVGMNLTEVNMAKHNKTIVAIGEKDGEQQLLMLRVVNVTR